MQMMSRRKEISVTISEIVGCPDAIGDIITMYMTQNNDKGCISYADFRASCINGAGGIYLPLIGPEIPKTKEKIVEVYKRHSIKIKLIYREKRRIYPYFPSDEWMTFITNNYNLENVFIKKQLDDLRLKMFLNNSI
jgi:hypothetical protein